MEAVYERRINYYETDRMGVTHHSNYIRFFEEARVFFMDKINLSYKSLEDAGIIMPVLSVDCKYLKSSGYDDVLEIHTSLSSAASSKASFYYKAVNKATGETVCEGSSSHGFLTSNFRPLNLKRTHPKLYTALVNSLN